MSLIVTGKMHARRANSRRQKVWFDFGLTLARQSYCLIQLSACNGPLRANGREESGVSGNATYDILHNSHFTLGWSKFISGH